MNETSLQYLSSEVLLIVQNSCGMNHRHLYCNYRCKNGTDAGFIKQAPFNNAYNSATKKHQMFVIYVTFDLLLNTSISSRLNTKPFTCLIIL